MTKNREDKSGEEINRCIICDGSLEYSVIAVVRGYCEVCKPDQCPECGCVNIKQRRAHTPDRTQWQCDNGCFFEVSDFRTC